MSLVCSVDEARGTGPDLSNGLLPITVRPTPAVNEKARLDFEAGLELPRLDSNQ